MTRRAEIRCPREPIGLGREEAAAFIGVSPNTFDKLVDSRAMPAPRCIGQRRVWHAGELEIAFLALPRAGDSGENEISALDRKWADVAA